MQNRSSQDVKYYRDLRNWHWLKLSISADAAWGCSHGRKYCHSQTFRPFRIPALYSGRLVIDSRTGYRQFCLTSSAKQETSVKQVTINASLTSFSFLSSRKCYLEVGWCYSLLRSHLSSTFYQTSYRLWNFTLLPL
jgi:hypothetical protein